MASSISLLIPCYNAAPFLPRLVESVQALTQPFNAVLCYDDGSTDDTLDVAQQLGLRIITGQSNRGVAHARNRLAAAATTEWIHFHDADDWIAPAYVERLAPWCTVEHDVVSCDADWVSEGTDTLLIPWRYDPAALARDPVSHLLARAMGLNSSIILRSKWLEIGGCDESLAMWEDADVHIRLAASGARFHHLPEVLTRSLRRGDSFSHDYRRSWNCRLDALEHYAAATPVRYPGPILAQEAETAALQLAALGDSSACQRAIALCRRLGVNPPTTQHPVLRLMKPLLPAHVLLRWQARRRSQSRL